MTKIINGKKYDTNTSRLIYSDDRNKRYYYMTPNGAFFCWYKKTNKFVVMTEDEMKEFLGENDPDMYEELFGDVPNA